MRDKVERTSRTATAAQLATQPIQYETGFTLLPGKYVIKFLVRDAEVGRIGTYQTSFTIPNLNNEKQRLPISTVVLGSQRVPLDDELYSVEDDRQAELGTRSFRRAEAAAERHARLQHVTRHARLPGGLRARRHDDAAARRVRELLPG